MVSSGKFIAMTNRLTAVEVQYMFANYVIWGGRAGESEDDFFPVGW